MTRIKVTNIHLNWEGPYPLERGQIDKGKAQHGLYQYYGEHPVYGQDTLLYIGKAFDQEISKRIGQHIHGSWSSSPIQIFIGRVASTEQLNNEQ